MVSDDDLVGKQTIDLQPAAGALNCLWLHGIGGASHWLSY